MNSDNALTAINKLFSQIESLMNKFNPSCPLDTSPEHIREIFLDIDAIQQCEKASELQKIS